MSNAAYPVLLGLIVVDSTNNAVKFTENGVTQTLIIASGSYFLRGDGTADDFCAAFKAALDSHTGGTNVYAVALSPSIAPGSACATVTISIASGGPNAFKLFTHDSDPVTTFDTLLIGFTGNTGNSTAAKVSNLSPTALWVSNAVYKSLEPVPTYKRTRARAQSGKVRAVNRAGEFRDRLWVQEHVHESRTKQEAIVADTGRALNVFVLRQADGKRFEWHDGAISAGTTLGALDTVTTRIGTFIFDNDFYPDGQQFAVRADGVPLYSFSGHLLPYVA